MRILTLCDVLFPQTTGGAGRLARELAEALVSGGDTVHFLTRKSPRRPDPDTVPTDYYPAPSLRLLGRFRKLFREVEARFQPDIIHLHQPLPGFLMLPLETRQPVVYTFHSSWPEEFKIKFSRWPAAFRRLAAPILAGIERHMVRSAAAVVVTSGFVQSEVRLMYQRLPVIIPGGVHSEQFQPLDAPQHAAPSLFDRNLRIVTVRNLVPRMGIDNLIRAIALLPERVSLQIGGSGPLRTSLDRLTRELHLEKRVVLCGHVPETALPRFYGEADLFVLPTVALEGFGLVTLESLSCGTPVLGTAIGAIPEVLSRFNANWIIPSTTPEAIAAAILDFMQQEPPDRTSLHQRVAAEYRWEIIAQRYRQLFSDLR